MQRKNRFVFFSAIVLSTALLAWGLSTSPDHLNSAGEANDVENSTATNADSRGSSVSPPVSSGEEFVVHEWGTFTTFSGSDGVFLEYRPLAQEHSDLPPYVLDRGSYSPIQALSKSRIRARVRMETPVTYFYTDRVRSVEVSVDFPQGLLTEFYPPVKSMLPPLDIKKAFGEGESIGESSLNWGKVNLIPQSELVPGIQDPSLRRQIADRIMRASVPHGPGEFHYAQARETDSALVHVHHEGSLPYSVMSGNVTSGEHDFLEKFLFYRGVGTFDLPVDVAFREDAPYFANRGNQVVRSVIMIESYDGQLKAAKLDAVAPGESVRVADVRPMSRKDLRDLVIQSLVDEGLYEKEAIAMVNTWDNSWFTDPGRRVLYMVPSETIDELLPLHIKPKPQETRRVLVGRMEIMSPDDEAQLAEAVRQSIRMREAWIRQHSDQKDSAPAYPIPKNITSWGRMTEPALVRVSKIANEVAVQNEAKFLLASLRAASSR